MVALNPELTSMGTNVEHTEGRTNHIDCEHSAQSFTTLYSEFKIFFPQFTETFLLHLYFPLRSFLTYYFTFILKLKFAFLQEKKFKKKNTSR